MYVARAGRKEAKPGKGVKLGKYVWDGATSNMCQRVLVSFPLSNMHTHSKTSDLIITAIMHTLGSPGKGRRKRP